MVKVAVLDDYQNAAFAFADWDSLGTDVEVVVFHEHLHQQDALVERLDGFEVIAAMRERTPFDRELLQRLPKLRLLITTAMANASFDMQAATELGIMVCGTGGLGYPTAELTWGLILAATRHIALEDAAVRNGSWQTTVGRGLRGKTLGVIGLGRLGSEVAAIGNAFQMDVIAWSQNLTAERSQGCGATLVSRDELFVRSDIVTIHLKLSGRTLGLIGARELGLMKDSAYLINTSRGPIVDEGSLVESLRDGTIAGAGLDVFDVEPLPKQHPLKELRNVVFTPHIGYVTAETYEIFLGETVGNIAAYVEGKPVRVLNPDVIGRERQH